MKKIIKTVSLFNEDFQKEKMFLRAVMENNNPYLIEKRKENILGREYEIHVVRYAISKEEFESLFFNLKTKDVASSFWIDISFFGGYQSLTLYQGRVEISVCGTMDIPEIHDEMKKDDTIIKTLGKIIKTISPKESRVVINESGFLKQEQIPLFKVVNLSEIEEKSFFWLQSFLLDCKKTREEYVASIHDEAEGKNERDMFQSMMLNTHIEFCPKKECIEIKNDWKNILHLSKYAAWKELKSSYKSVFDKYGMI